MSSIIQGIHHITGAVTAPQRDYEFYTKVLGLRLIKKTVNQDNPTMWHFFYGDHDGNPGTIMTNIILEGVPMPRCQEGRGSIEALSYSVPKGALGFWEKRLRQAGYRCTPRPERFGDAVLHFADPEGLSSELIACDDTRDPRSINGIDADTHIRGFHSATFISRIHELTVEFFTTLLRFEVVGQEGNRTRLAVNGGGPGAYIDLLDIAEGPWARFGLGSIHHLSFTVPTYESLERLWRILSGAGLIVTDARDRGWFHSMYFTEPGGINLEFSNLDPGWTVDEPLDELGTILSLPKRLEPRRAEIEKVLPKINF